MCEVLISIIVPVYNAEKYLRNCIKSILNQSYNNIEVILIDDGSGDRSLEICNKYASRDGRIKVFHQKNSGVSAARNYGLTVSSGEYCCFIDSDDMIEKDLILKLYEVMKRESSDMSICGFKKSTNNHLIGINSKSEYLDGELKICKFILMHYLEWLVSSPWGKMYKKSNITENHIKFDESISLGEDLKFNIEYFSTIQSLSVISDTLYIYNDNDNSLTKTYKIGNYEAICDIYRVTKEYVNDVFDSLEEKTFSFANVNYKLFSFCISFMSQNIKASTLNEEIIFIKQICNNTILQDAINDLPKISFIRKMYVWALKSQNIMVLLLLAYIKDRITRLKCFIS